MEMSFGLLSSGSTRISFRDEKEVYAINELIVNFYRAEIYLKLIIMN